MARRILCVLFLLAACLEASVTAAWKVPIEHFAPDLKSYTKVRKLNEPPGASGFFQAGDQLWDVSKLLWSGDLEDRDPFEKDPEIKRPWGGDWAVWNRRSGMLVARGGYFEILEAQRTCGFDKLPRLWLANFELKQGSVVTSLPISFRSGERIRTNIGGVEIEQDSALGRKSHDLLCSFTWKPPGEEANWNVTSSFSGSNDREFLLARHGSGASGWELRGTVSFKSIGDTPVADARWIEVGGKVPQIWDEAEVGQLLFERQPLGDGLLIGVYQAPPPLGEGPPPADLKAPERLREWIHGSFWSVEEGLKGLGVDTATPGFFAGIETRTSQLVLVGPEAAHDLVSKDLRPIMDPPPPAFLVETDARSGNWALLCGNDLKAAVTLTMRDKDGEREVKTFEVQPTLKAETSVALEYRGNFDANAAEPSKGEINLKPGDWQELNAPAEEGKPKLRASLTSP